MANTEQGFDNQLHADYNPELHPQALVNDCMDHYAQQHPTECPPEHCAEFKEAFVGRIETTYADAPNFDAHAHFEHICHEHYEGDVEAFKEGFQQDINSCCDTFYEAGHDISECHDFVMEYPTEEGGCFDMMDDHADFEPGLEGDSGDAPEGEYVSVEVPQDCEIFEGQDNLCMHIPAGSESHAQFQEHFEAELGVPAAEFTPANYENLPEGEVYEGNGNFPQELCVEHDGSFVVDLPSETEFVDHGDGSPPCLEMPAEYVPDCMTCLPMEPLEGDFMDGDFDGAEHDFEAFKANMDASELELAQAGGGAEGPPPGVTPEEFDAQRTEEHFEEHEHCEEPIEGEKPPHEGGDDFELEM